MNEKINADLKSLKFIFNKNRPYLLPAVIILISIILIFQFVIPQFGLLIATRSEAKEASLKLETLKANLDILTNVDEETLDSQLKVLSLALPLGKDFVGILNSVYSAAQKTGVGLGNFSFRVGDISQSENDDNLPVVKLSVPINSGAVAVNSFAVAIGKSVPLAEVYGVKIGNNSSMVNISFYYKPLSASNYSQDARVIPVSQKALTLISQLSESADTSSFSISPPVATSSAAE